MASLWHKFRNLFPVGPMTITNYENTLGKTYWILIHIMPVTLDCGPIGLNCDLRFIIFWLSSSVGFVLQFFDDFIKWLFQQFFLLLIFFLASSWLTSYASSEKRLNVLFLLFFKAWFRAGIKVLKRIRSIHLCFQSLHHSVSMCGSSF